MRRRKGIAYNTGRFTLIEGPNGIMQTIEDPFKQREGGIEMEEIKLSKTRYWIMFFCREIAKKQENNQGIFTNIGKVSVFKKEVMANVLTKVEQKSKNWFHAQIYFLKNSGLIIQEEDGTYSVDINTPLVIGRTRKHNIKKEVVSEEKSVSCSKILNQITYEQKIIDALIKKNKAADNLVEVLRQLPSDIYLYEEFMKLVKRVEKRKEKEEETIKIKESNIRCLKNLLD